MWKENLKTLRKHYKKSQEEVANDLNLTRSSYSGYENGAAEPSLETLMQLCQYFNISIDQILKKDFSTFGESDWDALEKNLFVDAKGQKLRVLATVIDQNNEELIELIPEKARAGYVNGYADPEYLKVLPTFSLPFLSKEKKYRSFPIAGDSMPPVEDGSYVVGEFIQNWNNIKNGNPCIIVTKEDGIVFKIVNNYLEKEKSFQLCSTNPLYEPYFVKANDILEMWKFVNYISPKLPEVKIPTDDLVKTVKKLQNEISELNKIVRKS